MKAFIEGFRQDYASTLKMKVEKREKKKNKDGKEIYEKKEVERKIDCTDLVLLRWFVDFYPKMKKMTIDGVEYAWVSYKKMREDLPLIGLGKRGFADRMQKLVDFNILTFRLIKESGNFTVYGFGENYINLVQVPSEEAQSNNIGVQKMDGVCCSNDKGYAVQATEVCCSSDKPFVGQPTNKDSILNNSDINIVNIKHIDKGLVCVLEEKIHNEELRDALLDYISMRKKIKKPLTARSLTTIINRLTKFSSKVSEQIEMVDEAIIKNWLSVYPLSEEAKRRKAGEEFAYLETGEMPDDYEDWTQAYNKKQEEAKQKKKEFDEKMKDFKKWEQEESYDTGYNQSNFDRYSTKNKDLPF